VIKRRHIGQALRHREAFEGGKPMLIVTRRIVVRFAALGRPVWWLDAPAARRYAAASSKHARLPRRK
jgi:hypothetical protein